jgi:hypothetical protein
VARLESKAPNDNLADDDLDLLNFTAVESMIVCQTSSRLQRYWPDSGKPDCPIWYSGWSSFHALDAGPAFPVLGHEDTEGGLWASLRLATLILLPLVIFWTFGLDHPRRPLFSYDDLLTLSRLSLRWSNQNLLPIKLGHVHIHQEWVFVELHLGTFYKFQSSFIYGRLNLLTKNIAIISSMRIRIMSFTIRMLLELFW